MRNAGERHSMDLSDQKGATVKLVCTLKSIPVLGLGKTCLPVAKNSVWAIDKNPCRATRSNHKYGRALNKLKEVHSNCGNRKHIAE